MSRGCTETGQMSPKELCAKYSNDVLYDAHSLRARIGRSDARKRLEGMGREVLPIIIEHLTEHPMLSGSAQHPELRDDLRAAWQTLLQRLHDALDSTKSGPSNSKNLNDWLSWAQRFSAT